MSKSLILYLKLSIVSAAIFLSTTVHAQTMLEALNIELGDSIEIQDARYPIQIGKRSVLQYAVDSIAPSYSYLTFESRTFDTTDSGYPYPNQFYVVELYKNQSLIDSVIINAETNWHDAYPSPLRYNHEFIPSDAMTSIRLSRPMCGPSQYEVHAIRRGDKLIALPVLESYGEVDAEFSYESFIAPVHGHEDEVWVQQTYGDLVDNDAESRIEEVVYYTCNSRYELVEQYPGFIESCRMDVSMRVNANRGLNLRYSPFIIWDNVVELIPDGSTVNLILKTSKSITIEKDGEEVSGEWCLVSFEMPPNRFGDSQIARGYVVDLYLEEE
ncbi:MAG: hypothetical protein HWD92_03960 [Flavobacteriia bacterium]|nr:hypothetical protein [Flavobacteriia bacterium]